MANAFGALRLLFALLVIESHSFDMIYSTEGHGPGVYLSGGPLNPAAIAVYGFFMISGYLVTQSLQRSSISGFLVKRILRIYPAFIVAYMACLLIIGSIIGSGSNPVTRILFDLLFLQQPLPPEAHFTLNTPMWTIPYEMRCYLLVLVLGASGVLRRRIVMLVGVVILMAIAAINLPLATTDVLAYFLGFPGYDVQFAVAFGVGALHYLFQDRIRYDGRIVSVAAPLWLIALPYPPWAAIATVTLGSYLLFWIAFTPRLSALHFVGRRIDLSYGTYLYGWPVEKVLLWYGVAATPVAATSATVMLALPLAALSWHLIERPALSLKHRAKHLEAAEFVRQPG